MDPVNWNKQSDGSVKTTFNLHCHADGTVTLEDPSGSYQENFANPADASRQISALIEGGLKQTNR